MVNQKKLESTQRLYEETRKAILENPDRWNDHILNAAAKFYKYTFDEQTLIHAQRGTTDSSVMSNGILKA